MKSHLSFTISFLLALIPMAGYAQDLEKMLDEAMCYACHQAQEASIGPPWQAIAARHASRQELMIDVLANKIVNGGGGNWGLIPMVPNQRVSDDQARQMSEWILEQN